jgi:hypothetical protein
MKSERWISACHEAGHGIASLVLGGKCFGLALYDGGQSGQASISELDANRYAFAVAAGPAAERLAEEYPAPNCTPAESRTLTVDEIESLPVRKTSPYLAAQLARTSDDRKDGPSDDRLIALWAIGGHEDQPDSWAGRVAHAHRIAADIVQRNATAIVAVATELYMRGSLCGPEVLSISEKHGSFHGTF